MIRTPSRRLTSAVRRAVESRPELLELPHMGGVSLRKTLVAALQSPEEGEFWKAASRRVVRIAKDIKYWDAVTILRVFATVQNIDNRLYLALSESVQSQVSMLAPKHIFDCIAAYESVNIRPKELYTSLFLRLQKLVPSMYSEELAAMVELFARCNIKHAALLENIATSIAENAGNIKFEHCCQIAGGFARLGFDKAFLYEVLDQQVRKEVAMMRPNEIFASIRRHVECSWKPFILELEKNGLVPYVASLEGATQIEQVTRPMELLAFLRFRGLLTNQGLMAFAKWALVASKRPQTRMSKRISAEDLAVITDLCFERGVAVETAKKAIAEFEKDEVDPPAPVQYARRRRYIRKMDAYVKARLLPVRGPRAPPRNYKQSASKWISANRENSAWLNFPLPWYYNR